MTSLLPAITVTRFPVEAGHIMCFARVRRRQSRVRPHRTRSRPTTGAGSAHVRAGPGAVPSRQQTTRTRLVQYAGASADYNPLHTDEDHATRVAGEPTVFAHGMLTMGFAARLVTDQYPPAAVTQFGGRFTARVWPGDTLTGTATVSSEELSELMTVSLELEVVNQDDVRVFVGSAVVQEPEGIHEQ